MQPQEADAPTSRWVQPLWVLFVIAKTFNFSFFEYYQDIFIYYKENMFEREI